jgi:hypothetical protein
MSTDTGSDGVIVDSSHLLHCQKAPNQDPAVSGHPWVGSPIQIAGWNGCRWVEREHSADVVAEPEHLQALLDNIEGALIESEGAAFGPSEM